MAAREMYVHVPTVSGISRPTQTMFRCISTQNTNFRGASNKLFIYWQTFNKLAILVSTQLYFLNIEKLFT